MTIADCGFRDEGRIPGRDLLIYFGPTLEVRVGFDIQFWLAQSANEADTIQPNLPPIPFPALVDTGATESCIDEALAEALELPVVDEVSIAGVGGAHQAQVYLAQIYIPELEIGYNGRVIGARLSDGDQIHRVLIGRNFLQHLRLVYDGPSGSVAISDNESTPWWRAWLRAWVR